MTPALGDRVLYYPSNADIYYARIEGEEGKPLAAFVARVHPDGRVNLMVLDQYGHPSAVIAVSFVPPGGATPERTRNTSYCVLFNSGSW